MIDLIQLESPPVLEIFDLWRECGRFPEGMALSEFEQTIINGISFSLCKEKEVIGYFMLTNYVPLRQIQEDLVVDPKFHGKWLNNGIMEKIVKTARYWAFEQLNVQRIVGFVEEDNTKSIKLTEKLGMNREGTLMKYWFRDGEWRNVHAYAMVRA